MECRAGTILSVHFLGAYGGTVQIFPFLWLCCSGYGRNGEGGWSVFLFTFFSMLSVLLAVGYLW